MVPVSPNFIRHFFLMRAIPKVTNFRSMFYVYVMCTGVGVGVGVGAHSS